MYTIILLSIIAVQCSIWKCILNNSVSDSYNVRFQTHDLFITLLNYWKSYGIRINFNSTWDVYDSIPSSELYEIIIHSLFGLAGLSLNEWRDLSHSEKSSENSLQSSNDKKLKKVSFPVKEMLITIYLHAFPFRNNDEAIPDNGSSEFASDDVFDDENKVRIPLGSFK